MWFLGINGISYWFNIYPLTSDEVRQQWVKYRYVGKLVYGLTFLDLEEDRKQRVLEVKDGHSSHKEEKAHGHSGHGKAH